MSHSDEERPLPARRREVTLSTTGVEGSPIATFARFEGSPSPVESYVGVLLRRRWTVLGALAAVFSIACLVTVTSPRIYEARATLLVSDVADGRGIAGDQQMPPMMTAMAAPDLETHVQLIQGESTARETAKWLKEHGGPALSAEQVRAMLRADAVPKTKLVRVSSRARSPEQAQRVANAAVESYVAMSRRRAQSSAESASRYLSQQLGVARHNLSNAENALRAHKEATGIIASDAAAGALLDRVASLRADADKTKADLVEARVRLAKAADQWRRQNASIATGRVRDNAVVQQLRAKLVELEGKRLAAQAKYTKAFPGPLEQIEEQIRITRQQLDREIANVVGSGGGDLAVQQLLAGQMIQGEAQVAALEARSRDLQAELAAAEKELQKIPTQQVALARLERQVKVAEKIYSDLLARNQEVEVGRVMALGNTEVAEPASLPRLPIKPNVPLNLFLGLLGGLALGIALAVLQEQFDDTVRDQEEVTRLLGAPVLATVPMLSSSQPVSLGRVKNPPTRAIDAYRTLRYNLGFVAPDDGARVVLVASAGPQEGKTTTALNLATAAALSGRRVVLVDSDLRRPSLRRLLGTNGAKGMTDVLVGQARLEETLELIPETGLRFLSAGNRAPNPTDLLDSPQMRKLLGDLRRQSDLVVFDSSPLLAAADGLVLASMSDAVLTVCVPGESHRRALQRARTLLNNIGHDISGVVINKVRHRAGYGYGYYGGYYYYYDYDREEGGPDRRRRKSRRHSPKEAKGRNDDHAG